MTKAVRPELLTYSSPRPASSNQPTKAIGQRATDPNSQSTSKNVSVKAKDRPESQQQKFI